MAARKVSGAHRHQQPHGRIVRRHVAALPRYYQPGRPSSEAVTGEH